MQENLSIEIPLPTHPNFLNRIGLTYGRLTVVQYAGRSGGRHQWKCLCVCGNSSIVLGCNLAGGNTTSCGCYGQEQRFTRAKTHGRSHTTIHNIWCKMVARCTKPSNKGFHYYGGRGISVCKGWRQFSNFYADMGERPAGLSLDRIDNNGGYWCGKCDECQQNRWPSNCRWATRSQQMVNRRCTRFLTYQGRTLNISQWAQEVGIKRLTITRRLDSGWSVEDALTIPLIPNDKSRRKSRRQANKSAPSNPTP